MPVYLYVHDLRASGVVRKAVALADYLRERTTCTLVAGYGGGDLRRLVVERGVPFRALSEAASGNGGRLAAARRLRRLIGQAPAVLVSMGNFGHPSVVLATRLMPQVRRIYVISNAIGRGRWWSDWLRHGWASCLARDAAHCVLVGTATGRTPVWQARLQSGHASEIHNGVDLAAASRAADAPCPHPWLDGDVPVVIAVGRIRPQKNFLFLIEAFAALRRQRRARLVILGGGSETATAELEARAEYLGVARDVMLAGVTTNVFAWLSRASLFVMPSRFEGSSNALLEAMAVRLPCVVSASAGDVDTVLAGGRYGRIASIDSPRAFARAMDEQLGLRAIAPGERIEAFDLHASFERYLSVIDEVAYR